MATIEYFEPFKFSLYQTFFRLFSIVQVPFIKFLVHQILITEISSPEILYEEER